MLFINLNSLFCFFIIGWCVGLFSNAEPSTDNGVYVLNKDNFDNFIKSNEVVMVEFYAPWCGHCNAFTPHYIQAATELGSLAQPIPLAKVDSTVETDLSSRFNIAGYPTLKFFKSGTVYDYDGERIGSHVVKFMKKISDPSWQPPKSSVLILTNDNFTDVVEKSGYILVEFFAPWCGHCKSLAPEYEKAASRLMRETPPIPLATVDATTETKLAELYNISAYPILKLFRRNKPFTYTGTLHSDGIVDWMLKFRKDSAQMIESVSILKELRDPQNVMLLGLFKNEDDLLFQIFIDATNLMRDGFTSAYSFNNQISQLYNVDTSDGKGTIVILKPEYLSNRFEPPFTKYNYVEQSNHTVENVVNFIEKNMFPIVTEFSHVTRVILNKFHKDYLCLFFFTVDFSVHYRKATKMWLEKITNIAVDYKDEIQFAIADDDRQADVFRKLRLDDSGEEINVGCLKRGRIKYRMPAMEEFNSDHIRHFLDSMTSGKLFPLLRSGPIPKVAQSDGIKTVVGDNYKSLINDVGKEALILLYRSPCQECRNSKSVLSEMSQRYSGKSLEFFSMDLTQNELPHLDGVENVDSQPSIYLIMDKPDINSNTVLRKRVVKYFGDHRNESEIRSFLLKNTKSLKDEL